MYQMHLRAQAIKLAARKARRSLAHAQQHTASTPRQHTSHLRAALTALTTLANLRVISGSTPVIAEQRDPCDPCNW